MIFGSLRKDLESEGGGRGIHYVVACGRGWRRGGCSAGTAGEVPLRAVPVAGMRRDVLFEACDAALCKQGRMLMLAGLCLEPECRRGHGAVHKALNCGEVQVTRMRRGPR